MQLIMQAVITATILLAPTEYDVTMFPAFVNPYDPDRGGINCNEDCSTTANGLVLKPEHYNVIAACHPILMGCSVSFTNDFGTAGPFLCSDTGGALLNPSYTRGNIVQYFDVLYNLGDGEDIDWGILPWWNHAVFDSWTAVCPDNRSTVVRMVDPVAYAVQLH